MTTVVGPSEIGQMIERLRADGRTVIAPTIVDGTLVPAEIETAADLPIGWTDEQGPGRYRVRATGTPEWFASSSPSDSWKRYLSPPETLLIRSKRVGDALSVDAAPIDAPAYAFVGIRSCDLAAIEALDRVFLAPGAQDPTYAARRADVFVIAAACAKPGDLCFCASMGTGPTPTTGFDVSVTEFCGDDRHEFLVTAASDRGRSLVEALGGRPATDADLGAAADQHDRAAAAMGRTLDAGALRERGVALDHPRWLDVGERCLACGNCTMVCPTCFCSRTTDRSDLTGDGAERWRVWDSCFGADFSSLHGTPVRAATADRYRQWLLHKLVTWHDQFDMSGCVGCGRCISACPVGIDLTVEIEELTTDG